MMTPIPFFVGAMLLLIAGSLVGMAEDQTKYHRTIFWAAGISFVVGIVYAVLYSYGWRL